ncbi:MAG TPA: Ig-like domain-containing protein, partial [Allosphingosinicella sp.]
MAVSFTITRNTTRFHDSNGNGVKDAGETDLDTGEVGVYDPGDILYTRITITNTGDQTATGVTVADNFTGSTMVNASGVAGTFINISPIAFNDTFQAIGNTVLRVGTAGTLNGGESTTFAGNLISNDIGSLAGDSIQGFKIDVVGDGTFAGSGITAKGGHYNILADGSFNYVNSGSDADLTDGDTFNYTIRDAGFDGLYNTADDLTSIGKVTITFAEQSAGVSHRVWYVDSAAAPGGDGTSANPFQTLASLNGAGNNGAVTGDLDQAGEYIYVENSGNAPAAAAGPITLENGQQLIGKGADLVVAGSTLATAGSNSAITAASGTIVTLASGNTIAGLNIGNGTGTANGIAGTAVGALTVNNVAVDAVGSALTLAAGAIGGSGFTTVNSDGGTNNVSFTNVTGTVNLGGGALTGASGASLNMVSTGAPNGLNVTYAGGIAQGNAGALVNVNGGSNGHTGTLTLTGALSATSGAGLVFNNADGIYNIAHDGTVSAGSATLNNVVNGVSITNGSIGAFKFGTSTALQTASGTTLVVDGGNGNITFDGTITDDQGQLVKITNRSGGTIDFNGLLTDNSDGDGGVSLAEGSIHLGGNTAGTFRFDGGINLSTGTNDALTSVNGAGSTATLVITDPAGATANKITTTSGQAIDIQNTTIGSGGLVFESVNVNGAGVGINLNTTGGTAGLTITGTGAAGSGGTIQNTGQGATFTSTSNVSLTNMNFTNANGTEGTVNNVDNATSNSGATAAINMSSVSTATFTGLAINGNGGTGGQQLAINGNVVSNFTLASSTISGHGDEAGEGGMRFWNLTGTSSITNSTFSFAAADATAGENHIDIRNGSGTLNLAMSGNTFNTTRTSASGSGGLSLTSGGTATVTANIVNNDFTGMKTSGVEVFARDTSTLNVNITNGGTVGNHNVFDRASGLSRAIGLNAEDTANLNFKVTDNVISGSGGPIINMFSINDAQVMGRINNNTITGGGAGAAGSAIFVHAEDHSNAIVEILNNVITSNGQDPGISVTSVGDGPGPSSDNSTLDVVIANNSITMTNNEATGGTVGIDVRAGANTGEVTKTAAYVHHNTVTTGGAQDFAFLTREGASGSQIYLQGSVAGGDNTTRATNNWNGNTNVETGPGGVAFAFDAGGAPAYTNPPAGAPYFGAVRTPTNLAAEAPPPAPPEITENPAGGGVAPVVDNGGGAQVPVPVPAPAPAPTGPIVVDDGVLSQAELDFLVDAAIQRWAAAGATDAQVAAMRAVDVSVSDLAGLTLGQSDAGTIVLDSDAAGWRWFVDSTPGDDSEYSGSGSRLTAADPSGLAGTRIDLLTVLTHELGHQIGLSDLAAAGSRDELMYGTIAAGERRLPGSDDLVHAAAGPVTGAFAFAPITIGTIPAGQKVIVEFRHSINTPAEDGFAGNWTGKATIDSDQTDAQDSNSETGAIDGLVLGDLVFKDVNKDGNYDAGTDTGIVGVALDLYADSNGSGGWDSGDTYLATTTSVAGGLYSFSGLAPGDYIVVVKPSNFAAGAALADLLITPGTATDPDDNVDGDNNGAAATGGAVAAKAIRLDYNQEGPTFTPDPGVNGEDTNNTVDFGFVENSPPVAVDDSGLTAVEDTPKQFSTQLTANDTDSDGDTITIVSAGNATNGSVSVNAGVVTFTPTANYNGTATFEYTISDGKGHTDVGLATVTVSAVNDAPVNTVGGTVAISEDSGAVALSGMSISDPDANPATDLIYVNFEVANGLLAIRTDVAGGIDGDDIIAEGAGVYTIRGTLNEINATLAASNGLTYTPGANFNGTDSLKVSTNDAGANGTDPGISGDGTSEQDDDSRTITVSAVNDAPVVSGDGTVDAAPIVEDTPGPGETVDSLFAGQYSDAADAQSGNPGGSSAGAFTGVAVVANGSGAATGQWQYYNADTMLWVDIGARSTASALLIANTTLIRFNPAPDFTGAAPTLTVNLIDNQLGFGITYGQVVDISGAGATGGTTPYSAGTVVLSQAVTVANFAPTLDLDASAAGTGFASSYTEGGAPASVGDVDVSITDSDVGDGIVSAVIEVANAASGDVLAIVGTLPLSITVDPSSTATKLILTGAATKADYEAAIEQVTFSNTGDNPTAGGTNLSRTINVTVNDGDAASNIAVATVTVADVNDSPAGTSSTITATEDSFRLLAEGDFGTVDPDGSFAAVTISAVSGGAIYTDSDGSAGPGGFVLATLPVTYSKQDLIDGKVAFKADSNLNGTGAATITFAVTDDDGATDSSSNTLTVNVTAVNDSPVVPDSPDVAASESFPAPLNLAAVSDVDLDARNGGAGDYGGAQFVANRSGGGNTQDQFILDDGPGFTVTGTFLGGGDIQSNGLTFGNWYWDGTTGVVTINFTSQQTAATTTLVNAVIHALQYNFTGDVPPASVNLVYTLNDGAPGGNQGSGAAATDSGTVKVNLTATNDGPWLDLTPAAGTDVTVNYTENDGAVILAPSASVDDPDLLDFDTGKLTVNLNSTGVNAEDRLSIAAQGMGAGQIGVTGSNVYYGGVLIGTFTGGTDGSTPLVVTFNANADQDAVIAVVRRIAYTNVSDAPTTADRVIGLDLTDGDGGQSNLTTATVHVAAVADAPIAQPDEIETPENAIATGSLFDNNNFGPDSDADGDTLTVSHVNGNPVVDGQEILLASGAKLIVNSDGTYSYNPNGKFNRLTDNTSGAVNTSAADSFTYTLTGGNTVNVNVTVEGVAGPGDWLEGDGTNNTITGTPQADFFFVVQGGDDNLSGLGGNDVFFFGPAMTSADKVNGGEGTDQIALQGDYSAGLTFGPDVVSVENLAILPGNDTRFGDPGTNFYDYNLTLLDVNVASGVQMIIDANRLRVGEDFTFNGSAETNGSFFIYGGGGTDNLTGGAKNDVFLFGAQGQWGSTDRLDGGGGIDQLALRGDYTITFGATQLVGIEQIALVSAYDTRFGDLGD